jgi:PAP2 superfamily
MFFKRQWIYIFVIVLILVTCGIATHALPKKETGIDTLRFSNTQTWDPDLYASIATPTFIDSEGREEITLPQPPANSSQETNKELQQLHSFIEERTPEKIEEIKREMQATTTIIGPYSYAYITNSFTHQYTKQLLDTSLLALHPIIISFKNQFDRVRPSYLDPTLTTVIPVPKHPAYPSGHATQWYFIAKIMSDVDPTHNDTYMQSAYAIAHNREIAGLHYPSDSEAGRLLGEQCYKLLSATTWYKDALKKAQKEWNN